LGNGQIDPTSGWEFIAAHLPCGWRELGEDFGLVRTGYPAYMGTKVTEISQPLRLILHQVATNSSLAATASKGATAGIVEMSAVGLHKWMRKIGPYLARLVTMMTDAGKTFDAAQWGGCQVMAVDRTSVFRHGRKRAHIHYALQMTTMRPVEVAVSDDETVETFSRFRATPGQIWIGDQAYANRAGIAAIEAAGGYVLVRYGRDSLPLRDMDGTTIDLRERLADAGPVGAVRQWLVEDNSLNDRPIRGRLCVMRLSPEHAARARARAMLNMDSSEPGICGGVDTIEPSSDHLVVFTTAPASQLRPEQVIRLYQLRERIELHLASTDSLGGQDRLCNFRQDTIYSWICAKLLLVQLARKMLAPRASVPVVPILAALAPSPGIQATRARRSNLASSLHARPSSRVKRARAELIEKGQA